MRKGHLCYSFHFLNLNNFFHEKIPCDPFLSLNNLFDEKIPTRITPHTGGQEKISMRKEKKPWESQKGIRAQETQMLGGMPKSLEKVTSKIKWVCPIKARKKKKGKSKKRAAKENMNDVKSQTVDSDPRSLKPWNTLSALWTIFFHSQEPQPTLRACRSPF